MLDMANVVMLPESRFCHPGEGAIVDVIPKVVPVGQFNGGNAVSQEGGLWSITVSKVGIHFQPPNRKGGLFWLLCIARLHNDKLAPERRGQVLAYTIFFIIVWRFCLPRTWPKLASQ
jgi:hypothetical protein